MSRLDPRDSRTRAELLDRLGAALRDLCRWDEAYGIWDEALGIFTALNDQDGAGRTCLQLAEGAGWSSKRREVLTRIGHFLAQTTTVSIHRALLLAVLALGKSDDDEAGAAEEALMAALALAEELPDSGTKGAIPVSESQFNFACLRLREAHDDSLESAELISAVSPWVRAEQLLWYVLTLLHLGRAREAYKVAQELERSATRIGHVPALLLSRATLAWVEFWQEPNLDQVEDAMRRDFDARIGGAVPFFVSILSPEQLSSVNFFRGNWDDSLRFAETARSPESPRHIQSINIALRFRTKAYSGDREGALKLLEDRRKMVARVGRTNSYGSWALLITAVERLYVLSEGEQVATPYPMARRLTNTGVICHTMMSRFPQTVAGIAAAAAHNWQTAEGHFQVAMQQAESFPSVIERADIRRFHAMMLIDRTAPRDREKARALLNDALQSYQCIRMPGHVGLTQALLDTTEVT